MDTKQTMRCRACNVILTPLESIEKDEQNRYIELCSLCLEEVNRSWGNDDDDEYELWEDYDERTI